MSKKEKVTIKFWDIEKLAYEDHGDYYLINDNMEVYTDETSGYTSYLMLHKNIEPHFYIGNKRIG